MYSREELKNKIETSLVLSEPAENLLAYFKIDPVYEDETGEEYFDDYVLNLVKENFINLQNHQTQNYLDYSEVKNKIALTSTSLIKQENNQAQENRKELLCIIEKLFSELQQYSSKVIETEKKLYMVEESERRIKEEFYKTNSEVIKLNEELEQKNKKIVELKGCKEKLQNIETQLQLKKLQRKKKKFWEFWK